MKKSILIYGLLIVGLIGSEAYGQGMIRLNAGLIYGEDISEAGFNLGAELFVTDNISVAPSFESFFVDPGSLWGFNIDGRYYFVKSKAHVYGLFGFAFLKQEISIFSDEDGGINLGAGVVVPVGRLGVHGQVKYATPFNSQLVLQGGVTYRLKG